MQPTQTNARSTLKRIAFIVGGLLLIAGIGLGVVWLLKTIAPTANNSLTPTQVNAVSPQETLAAYIAPGAIKGLGEDSYQLQANDDTSNAYVIYKSGDAAYTISTPTPLQAIFYAKNATQENDTSAIEEQTTAFLKTKGYDKINNTGSASKENPRYVTYASSLGVCQLSSSHPLEGTPTMLAFHALACVEKLAIDQEYAATEQLLTIYKQANQLPSFNEVTRITKTDGNKSLAIVSLSGGDRHPSLLFASVDNSWTYIGDLGGNTESNGKYTITPEIKGAINDPKYGDFLKKNIQ